MDTSSAPAARRDDVRELIAGHEVADPYRWLEDPDSPATRDWLAAQADLFARARDGWRAGGWFRELRHLTSFERLSVPQWRGGRAFYTCLRPGAEHHALMVRDHRGDRALFEPDTADPRRRTVLGYWSASADGRLMAYQTAVGGSERFTLRVLDVDTGTHVDEPITGCRYSAVAWVPGQDAFYYTRHDERSGPRVHLHRVGRSARSDTVVLDAGGDRTAELDALVGQDGRLLVVQVAAGLSAANEVWVADLRESPLDRPALRRLPLPGDGWTSAWPAPGGRLYLLTDAGAPRGRLLVAGPPEDGGMRPRTLIPEDPEAVLDGFAVLDGLLLAHWTISGRGAVTRHDLATGGPLGQVELPGPGLVTELAPGGQGDEAWYEYSDRVTPETVYRYQAGTGTSTPWRRRPAPTTPPVRASQTICHAPDGTPVRILLLAPSWHRAGPLPTILEGYGAFGEPRIADYYAAALAWAGRGGLFAVACVRGGGEGGEAWHHAGRREHKQRGIDDFIAAAEHLVTAGHTTRGSLGAFGTSAGGLLTGAALTQRPELFAAVACTSPLLDMARYELTGLGEHWREEFGSRESPEELGWLLGYSPYHRVVPGTPYPAVLLSAFGEDTRVDPLHARKMTAALQFATTSPRPVLLRHEAGAGHGERGRTGRLSYFADVLAFFAHELGLASITPTEPKGGELP
ncbi:prolyl oligopeptidase family serine peptidase [Nonomuraea gerenzanensis]|uniref:prolyl oligopeptidase n=1 Tax=Nonomuraea gerenzanensis TaxID=93944 RepID=A0A1M4EEZ5_9ACTN|nr:prolyl oligopeptidase family serine peptidase [Nonomuraea gerenzanensis]UBU08974.1 prolyl oligopeptidase family serine peptidase [Nonomuraea gerenzanensis]SBO97354.1 Prolyl endopeptidase [Nonomuraea gerenzanensis]